MQEQKNIVAPGAILKILIQTITLLISLLPPTVGYARCKPS